MQDEKIEQVVERLYKVNPKTRDNNNYLVIEALKEMGFIMVIDIDQLFEMPSFEAITRAGRKIKESHPELKGSQEAEERKQELEKEYHSKYANYRSPVDDTLNEMKRIRQR